MFEYNRECFGPPCAVVADVQTPPERVCAERVAEFQTRSSLRHRVEPGQV